MTKLLLRALAGETLERPPIWLMRQAGRYLPEYRAKRAEAGSFLDLCYNPDFAVEVTLQPIRRFGFDASILFSDILVVPHALGRQLDFVTGEGPRLDPLAPGDPLPVYDPERFHAVLRPVYDTVAGLRRDLPPETTLIGFAGAPWTVATYMLAGRGSKDPSALRAFAYAHEEAFDRLISLLVEATTAYLIRQVKAGAQVVQLFDSWATGLPEPFFDRYCRAPVIAIAKAVKGETGVPVIAFPRGSGPLYPSVAAEDVIDGVSIDTGMPWGWARSHLSPHGAVQGGLDPLLVVAGGSPMLEAATALLKSFEGMPFVFNLGHGFVPHTPPENVAALVAHIRSHG